MTCKSIISTFYSFLNAAGFFCRNARSGGAAEGGCGGNSAAPERSAERSEAGQRRFRFLDLCIRFGKMISKVCESFNSGASAMVYQNQNLITHSGFVTDTHAESVQVSSEPIFFSYWFWRGGFVVVISYVLIAMGTGIFIKYLFSVLKNKTK